MLQLKKIWQFSCLFQNYFLSLPRLGQSARAGQVKDIDGILRPTKPFVGLVKGKGRFRTLLSVCSNFATLNLCTEVMQLKRPRG